MQPGSRRAKCAGDEAGAGAREADAWCSGGMGDQFIPDA